MIRNIAMDTAVPLNSATCTGTGQFPWSSTAAVNTWLHMYLLFVYVAP